MKDQTPRNLSIDIAKLLAALLVVGIHTNLFADVHPQLHLIFTELLCRMGVPFFALCSGYFLVEKENLWPQWWKLVKLYGVWTVVYLLWLQMNWIETGYISVTAYVGYIKSAVLSGSYFHLWYVLYVIYALPVFWAICRFLRPRWWVIIALLLSGIYALYYGYENFLPSKLYTILSFVKKGYAIGEAQFLLLSYLLVGAWLRKVNCSLSKRGLGIMAMVSFLLLVVEAENLKMVAPDYAVSRIFMILPTATAIFCLIKNIKITSFPINNCARLSLLIYCIHPIFCYYINPIATNSVVAWGVVSVVSLLFAYLLSRAKSL